MSRRPPRWWSAAALGLALTLGACTTEPKPATAISFFTQPAESTAGQVITPPVEVGFVDADGARVTSGIQADITLTMAGGTSGGTLSGTVTRPTVNGVATFDDLRVTPAAAGYRFTAIAVTTPCDDQAVECQEDSEFAPKTSEGFNVLPQ